MKAPKAKAGGAAVSPEASGGRRCCWTCWPASRTPPQAAEALGLSLPRYYQLEDRATGAGSRSAARRGRGAGRPTAESKAAALAKEVERLKQELGRYQALVRLTQRTVGVPPPAAPAKAAGQAEAQAGGAGDAAGRAAAGGGEQPAGKDVPGGGTE